MKCLCDRFFLNLKCIRGYTSNDIDHIKNNELKILKCTCISNYQDYRYGAGNRLFNPKTTIYRTDDGKCLDYRCTVCGTEIDSLYNFHK